MGRALARAGYPHLKDVGIEIKKKDGNTVHEYTGEDIQFTSNVVNMYNKTVKIEDFSYTLTVNEELWQKI